MKEHTEIKLTVKNNSYKDLRNYLHNELKLTKLEVEELIEKFILVFINEKFNDEDWTKKYIDKNIRVIVGDSIGRLSSSNSWKLSEQVDSAIQKHIGQYVMDRVKEQMKNIKGEII